MVNEAPPFSMNVPSSAITSLVVDSREIRSGMLTRLHTMGVPTMTQEMPAGDYSIGPYLIERKTANDLAASIMDGRLFEQAELVCNSAERPMLLIEGDITRITSQIQTEALMGAISTLTVFWSLQVVQLPDMDTTARYLARLHKHLTEGLGYEVPTRVQKPRVAPDGAAAQYIVSGLPGVGPELARKLLGHFGCARAVFQATESDLRQCKGVGPTTAKNIAQALDLTPKSFRVTRTPPSFP